MNWEEKSKTHHLGPHSQKKKSWQNIPIPIKDKRSKFHSLSLGSTGKGIRHSYQRERFDPGVGQGVRGNILAPRCLGKHLRVIDGSPCSTLISPRRREISPYLWIVGEPNPFPKILFIKRKNKKREPFCFVLKWNLMKKFSVVKCYRK